MPNNPLGPERLLSDSCDLTEKLMASALQWAKDDKIDGNDRAVLVAAYVQASANNLFGSLIFAELQDIKESLRKKSED